jgi:hypothetical protein
MYIKTNIPNTRKNKNRKQTGNKNEMEEKIGVRVVAFNAPFNNISVISWQSVLLVEETGVPGENHRPVARQCQTLSHKIASSAPRHERDSNSQPLW